jgi:light-regulated signal transduction histidine kinase (bacteriophytochrome)
VKGETAGGAPPLDLTNCDREPIHVPGAIQPYGALLVLREPELTIRRASANAPELLGVPASSLLGAPLAAVLGPAEIARVSAALRATRLAEENPIPIELGGRRFHGILHRHLGNTIFELEPAFSSERAAAVHPVHGAVTRLGAAHGVGDLCAILVDSVHALTGFDRVQVYRFDADENGEVFAEAKAEELDSYLGRHFPASDIPRQARELYRLNWIRYIPDAVYTPAPLVPPDSPDDTLDLSFAVLRSVSPIHLEYVANMGLRATMSISLVHGQRLWGLVTCGHRTPRYVDYELRASCELLGRIASLQLGAMVELDEQDQRSRRRAAVERLAGVMRASDEGPILGLFQEERELLSLVDATGVVASVGGQLRAAGTTPPPEAITRLLGWLNREHPDEVFATDRLPYLLERGEELRPDGSGILTFALPKIGVDRLIWFRPEVVRTVSWSGNPQKPVETSGLDSVPRLHPRRSFALWQEEVEGTAQPWSSAELAAIDLRRFAIEIDLQRQVLREHEAQARLAFLAESSALLGSSLDFEQTLVSVGRLATARFCDLCVIDLVSEKTGAIRRAHVFHADPTKQLLAERLHAYPPRVEDLTRTTSALLAGRPTMHRRIDVRWLKSVTHDDVHFALLWNLLGARSIVAVPLVARQRRIGVLLFVRTFARSPFEASDSTLAEELTHRASLAIDNALLYQDAQRAVRARDDLVAVVSHDLRSPLGVIQMQARMMQHALVPLDPKLQQGMDRIERGARRMAVLIEDLVDMAKLEEGRFVVEPRPETVGRVVGDAMELLEPLAERKSIRLTLELSNPEQVVQADADRIHRVLTNLVGNAIKFTPVGGEVRLVTEPGTGHVRFSVIDNGEGLSAEQQPHVFDRSWKAERRSEGSGLGLYIAKGIVEGHGGHIWVESEPGKGARFYFTLPSL